MNSVSFNYSKYIRAVLLAQLALVAGAFAIAYIFWTSVCDNTLEGCFSENISPVTFLILCVIRPFVFTPLIFIAVLGGKAFGPLSATALVAIGATLSGLAVFGLTKIVGQRLSKPWLRANLPATFNFIRSQDYKIVFAARLIPFIPFDLASFLFGFLDFRSRSVAIATLLGVIPEAWLLATLVHPSVNALTSTLTTLLMFAVFLLLPLLFLEFLSRKKGSGMWQMLKAMYRELTYEVQTTNDIVKRQHFDPQQGTPVLLLYGFFSSRRALTVLERMLTAKGHQVLSFNLGGLLGTFFTSDILETANFIDYKIKRQIERHGFEKFHIVAHSKGGLVALWWVLKLGGHRSCSKVITMGTPFKGSPLTYMALITPLGFIWRDIWQMRPGSRFLKALHDSEIPSDVKIFCLHSRKDRVAYGKAGIFTPLKPSAQVRPIAMDHISHFEFLYRKDVGDMLAKLLEDDEKNTQKALGA